MHTSMGDAPSRSMSGFPCGPITAPADQDRAMTRLGCPIDPRSQRGSTRFAVGPPASVGKRSDRTSRPGREQTRQGFDGPTGYPTIESPPPPTLPYSGNMWGTRSSRASTTVPSGTNNGVRDLDPLGIAASKRWSVGWWVCDRVWSTIDYISGPLSTFLVDKERAAFGPREQTTS